MVEPVRHRQTKEAGTDMFEPKATAPHLDSTATTFVITHSPSRSDRRDGLSFLGNARSSENGPTTCSVLGPSRMMGGDRCPISCYELRECLVGALSINFATN